MKSDVIWIKSDGDGMDAALLQAEKTASFVGIQGKDALHLRLLTEEMLGLMRSLTGTAEGRFWIETDKGLFKLHLAVETFMDFEQKQKLLASSTTGKNEAARGFMGRIRTFFDPIDGMPMFSNVSPDTMTSSMSWSMNAYQDVIMARMAQQDEQAKEAYDELEKSVVTHVADEIKVSISGRDVEMVIYKKMG